MPDGVSYPAEIERREPRQMLISGMEQADLKAGALVEVQSSDMIYLGQVSGWRESRLLVDIEHFLSRTALAELHQAWNMKDGSN
jgi:hypothetical protein